MVSAARRAAAPGMPHQLRMCKMILYFMRTMNSSNSNSNNDVPEEWGWSRFFTTMSTFLHSLESQENASEAFSQYVVNRLELCMQSVATIIPLLQRQNPTSETASLYSTPLCELLECLRSIYCQWGTYLDRGMHGYTTSTSYLAPLTYTGTSCDTTPIVIS